VKSGPPPPHPLRPFAYSQWYVSLCPFPFLFFLISKRTYVLASHPLCFHGAGPLSVYPRIGTLSHSFSPRQGFPGCKTLLVFLDTLLSSFRPPVSVSALRIQGPSLRILPCTWFFFPWESMPPDPPHVGFSSTFTFFLDKMDATPPPHSRESGRLLDPPFAPPPPFWCAGASFPVVFGLPPFAPLFPPSNAAFQNRFLLFFSFWLFLQDMSFRLLLLPPYINRLSFS